MSYTKMDRDIFRAGASYFFARLSTKGEALTVGAGYEVYPLVLALQHWDESGQLDEALQAWLDGSVKLAELKGVAP